MIEYKQFNNNILCEIQSTTNGIYIYTKQNTASGLAICVSVLTFNNNARVIH